MKDKIWVLPFIVVMSIYMVGCDGPNTSTTVTVCTTHEWEWRVIQHSPTRDRHEAQTCRHCGETAETREVPATLNFTWYGDGSAANFSIATPQSMFAFAHIVNGTAPEYGGPAQFDFTGRTVTLLIDIDLNNHPWIPIGTMTQVYPFAIVNGFNGVFNGGGNAIIELYVNSDFGVGTGLFSALDTDGKIKNLGVYGNVSSSVMAAVGGIVGWNFGTVENNYFSGSVNTDSSLSITGGLVGINQDGTIANSHNTGSVSGTGTVGGVAGSNTNGTVFASFNTGNVYGASAGGVVGTNFGQNSIVSNNYNTGIITGRTVGGVVMEFQSGSMQNNYNTGIVISTQWDAGGVVGIMGSSGVATYILANNVSLVPQIMGTSNQNRVVGRVGGTNSGTYENNRARSDMLVNGVIVSGGTHDNVNGADVIPGITPMAEVFAGWDTNIWNIPSGILTIGGPLPTLRNIVREQNPTLPTVEE